jgi:hypothetical protein
MINFVEQLSAIALLTVFLAGGLCGVVGSASLGSRSEDQKRTLLQGAPGPVSDGARVVNGLYAWDDDGYLNELLRHGAKAPASPLPDEPGSHGQELDR